MEVVAESKFLTVHMRCDKCGIGLMLKNGNIAFMTEPPLIPHKCNYCGHEEAYSCVYPNNRAVPVEQLRKPRKEETVKK